MNTKKNIKDSLCMIDESSNGVKQHTLWNRTQIIGGYGLHKNSAGISELDEVVFEEENMVVIGGVQYAMEVIFGIKGPLNTDYLNNLMGIGVQSNETVGTLPHGYPLGHAVCLFGVGTGGAAENNSTVHDVKYNEREVSDMIPFRYTNEPLSGTDVNKYYGKKQVESTTAYYLKRFDSVAIIRHLWKDGEEGEDGTEVDSDVYSSARTEPIESFTEIVLTITKKDVKEWFKANGGVENSRINSIGLFTGLYNEAEQDYEKIKLFSKLNIPTEPLSMAKDLNIIYRVYGS